MSHLTCNRDLHSQLDIFQHEAVHLKEGAYLIAACAGSGKSTTIVYRVEQLVYDGVNTKDIGVFTFAKDAATELTKRLKELNVSEELTVSTLHSLCYSIIREDGPALGGSFTIDDKSQIFYGLKDLNSRNFRGVGLDPKVAQSLFALAKSDCLSMHPLNEGADKYTVIELFKKKADKPWLANAYCNLFEQIETWKWTKKIIDFEDQLYLSWKLLTDNETVRAKWQDKFKYLLIDEAQDSSTVQNAVANILTSVHNNISRIGDVVQSLYSWRGAKPYEFTGYKANSTLLKLPVNYRSTKEICTAATELTKGVPWNITGETIPHEGAPSDITSIVAVEYTDPKAEADSIAKEIMDLQANGSRYGDMAVLYRVVALLQPIEAALLARNIPYVVWSGYTFYDRKEIKDVLAYLHVASMRDPTDMWIKRALNVPFRYIGRQYIQCVEEVAQSNQCHFIDALCQYKGPRENQNTNVKRFTDLLFTLNGMFAKNMPPVALINKMITETKYIHNLKQEEGEGNADPDSDHITHVQQLINMAKDFSTVGSFLDYVSRMEKLLKESRHKKKVDAVVLSSIHKFKGIERDYVFSPGWNENILPHIRNPDPDEELRIAYVAITRAAKRFQASWTQTQITQGGMTTLEPSRFIARSKMPVRKLQNFKVKQNADVLKFLQAHPEFIGSPDER